MIRRAVAFMATGMIVLNAAAAVAVPPPTDAPSWQRAIGPWAWSFPRDHGAHSAFKTEWWYFTGNLSDSAQNHFGYQLTIFRQGLQFTPAQTDSKWAVRDFYFGHFTISDIARQQFHVAEKVSRGALGEAHATSGQMDVAIGPWTIQQAPPSEDIHLVARDAGIAIDFTAHPAKPLVLEGVKGLSQKADGAGEASYYYSYPRLATSGQLTLDGKARDVSGLSWFDHEFSTSSLGKDQVGWDWFCVQLDNNEELMLYDMRDKSGAIDPQSEGTWVQADVKPQRLPPGSFTVTKLGTWRSPHTGAVYSAGWRLDIPGHQAQLTVIPAMADQELHLTRMGGIDYWEGACTISGTLAGKQVQGVGYTELTGYAGALQAQFKQ